MKSVPVPVLGRTFQIETKELKAGIAEVILQITTLVIKKHFLSKYKY